ncbi:choice-of-anchor P family protein [Nocardioides sp. URHA0032]|uniref:choice-of-anchor P family protein n=1 Tax=Nocardioides sp. URHA0032 TaxID=1380388 RepID=UPI0004908977|nr:choice-of-anchor P family protein [Nocardioides sp. URHA0032]
MNTSPLRRAVATVSVCAAGFAGALATTPAADAAHHTGRHAERGAGTPVKTDLGYKGTVYGTKLLLDGVEVRNAKTAFAQQRCTRYAGREVTKGAEISDLGIPLVAGGLSTSYTQTYRKDGVHGVRGVSTIGDLSLGGEFQGQQTPTLDLTGLVSTADAFQKADGTFGHTEGFSFGGLSIGNLPDQVPQELQDLLDVLGQTTGDIVGQVIDVLHQAGDTIDIPGLGSIGLAGVKSGKTTDHSASSQSYALRLTVTATGHPTEITLGRARTAIYEPVPAGVFQSRAMGLALLGSNDLVSLGGLEEQSLPCSGSNGKVQKHSIADVRVLGGLVGMTGVQYDLMGDQSPNGAARGFVRTTIGSLNVPSIGLVIDGITSKVNLRKAADTTKVQRTVQTSIAKITLNGEEIAVPTRAGQIVDLGSGNFLKYRVISRNSWTGVETRALTLTLPDLIPDGAILDLAWAGGHISPN